MRERERQRQRERGKEREREGSGREKGHQINFLNLEFLILTPPQPQLQVTLCPGASHPVHQFVSLKRRVEVGEGREGGWKTWRRAVASCFGGGVEVEAGMMEEFRVRECEVAKLGEVGEEREWFYG